MTTPGALPIYWNARRCQVFGSRIIKQFETREDAMQFARDQIKERGNVGRIVHVSEQYQNVYFDIYPESE